MSVPLFQLLESTGKYHVTAPVSKEDILHQARLIVEDQVSPGMVITSPGDTKDFFIMQFAGLEHEVFSCLFLDTRHRVLSFRELFVGTIDGCSVHPREVVKAGLKHNSAAVIFGHNHPSGVPEPSQADQRLTQRLREALSLIDIRVLDHIVVGGSQAVSFAELGLI